VKGVYWRAKWKRWARSDADRRYDWLWCL